MKFSVVVNVRNEGAIGVFAPRHFMVDCDRLEDVHEAAIAKAHREKLEPNNVVSVRFVGKGQK